MKKEKKRGSLRTEMMLAFGLLLLAACLTLGILAVRTASNGITEKVEIHLIDKATDTAEIIDGRVNAFWQFLEGIARMPAFRDPTISYSEKSRLLDNEAAFNDQILDLNIADRKGLLYTSDGRATDISNLAWYKGSNGGQKYFSEPFMSPILKRLVMAVIVPVIDNNNHIASLVALIPGIWLTDAIDDIVVGKTGYCYILGLTGTNIADPDEKVVQSMWNTVEKAKTDSSLKSLAEFEALAVEIDDPSIGFYEYGGVKKIASYATMKTTDWTVIVSAPKGEFMGMVNTLRISILITAIFILLISLVIVYFIALVKVRPIQNSIPLLEKIAHGDFTVRLPVHGNNEITTMFEHLNETIAKIGSSIKSVGDGSKVMQSIGDELSSNMTETASAINEITSNIDGVKQQTLSQAASVTETSSTVEEIIRTI